MSFCSFFFFFFFQAEDGIRDLYVTGVQTCALPISLVQVPEADRARVRGQARLGHELARVAIEGGDAHVRNETVDRRPEQIGRASCRERVEISVGGGSL